MLCPLALSRYRDGRDCKEYECPLYHTYRKECKLVILIENLNDKLEQENKEGR